MSLNVPLSNSSPSCTEFNFNKKMVETSAQTKQGALLERTWGIAYPEVLKACYLGRICTHVPPKCCRYKDVASIIQSGPTCGLTALSMLLDGQPSPAEILKLAKARHFTSVGEMFSAQNFFELVDEVSSQRLSSSVQCQLHKGRLNCVTVIERLQGGACIFVPYDSDYNHGPCLKLGHKAHWALIIGYLIDNDNEFYVLARHGKTKNIAVWSLRALSESNSNLSEFSQPKGYPNTNFLVPDGGIGGKLGLRNRSVIVEGISTSEIIIV